MDPRPTTEAEQFAKILAGDMATFADAVKVQYPLLCEYASTILKAPDVAEEIVQDVLFQVWTTRTQIDATGSFQGYLFRLVRNRALNHLHRLKLTEKIETETKALGAPPGMSRGEINALDQIILAEVWERVHAAIERMPNGQRTVFLLRWDQGLSYAEIADMTGGTIESVRRQLTRALHALRQAIPEESAPDSL